MGTREYSVEEIRALLLSDAPSDALQRVSFWEALLGVPSADTESEYARLVKLGPSRLHFKIVLDLPRTLKGEPALSSASSGPARLRLLDAFVHWFDAQQAAAQSVPLPASPAAPAPATPSTPAPAVGASTTADILGEDVDEDWDVDDDDAPAPVLPSAVRSARVLVLPSARTPVASPRRDEAKAVLAAATEAGGYAQGMGSLAATLLCALPPPVGGGAASPGGGAAALPELRAFALLQAIAGPHRLARPAAAPASPPPLWVRGFYEPGNGLVRRGCALADEVLGAVDPQLRGHLAGGRACAWGGGGFDDGGDAADPRLLLMPRCVTPPSPPPVCARGRAVRARGRPR